MVCKVLKVCDFPIAGTHKARAYLLIFDQFQNNFLVYDQDGKFLGIKSIGDTIENEYILIDLLHHLFHRKTMNSYF